MLNKQPSTCDPMIDARSMYEVDANRLLQLMDLKSDKIKPDSGPTELALSSAYVNMIKYRCFSFRVMNDVHIS